MHESRKSFASLRHIFLISFTLIFLISLSVFFVLGSPDTKIFIPTEAIESGGSTDVTGTVNQSDGSSFTVTKNNYIQVNSWNDSISGPPSAVVVNVEITGGNNKGGIMNIQENSTGTFTTRCSSTENYVGTFQCDLYSYGVNTQDEVNNLYIRALVTDAGGAAGNMNVDYIYVNVTYTPTSADNPPTVTLNSPANNTNQSSASVNFNCTAWDDINLTNVTLYGNWSGGWHDNETNISGINDTDYVFTKTISDGTYVWNCKAMDNSSNSGWGSSNWTFTIDTQAPVIDDATHSINESLIGLNSMVKLNVSISDNSGSINTTLFNLDGTNYTANDNYPEFYLERTCTVSGAENWQETWANDSVGNPDYNSSVGLSWECDAQAPQVSNLISNDTSPDYNDWIRLNCTINDTESYLNDTWLEVDRPVSVTYNTSLIYDSGDIYYKELQITELGDWNFTCYANDTLSQENSTDVYTVTASDQTPPVIDDATHDINVSLAGNDSAINFSVSITDNSGSINTTLFQINNVNYSATDSYPVFYYIENCNSTTNGTRSWQKTFANDSAGNSDSNESVGLSYECDAYPPQISNSNANETETVQNKWFCINATVTDANIGTVLAEVWNTTSWLNYTMTDTGSTSCDGGAGDNVFGRDIQGTAIGLWNYSAVYANDTLNQWNSSDFDDITVNVTEAVTTLSAELVSISPQSINQGDYSTVTGNCTVNGGSVTNAYMIIESNQTGSWGDIQTSGQNLTTNVTFYSLGNLNDGQEESRQFNLTSNVPNLYYILIRCNSTNVAADDSSVGTLEVNDTESPVLTSAQRNESLSNGIIKLNMSVTDNVAVSAVLFEVNNTNYTQTGNSGDEWYYNWNCSESGSGKYYWNVTYANDTSNNWNSTTEQNLPLWFECDINAPLVENGTNDANGTQQLDTIANITCDAEDPEGNNDTIWLFIDRPGVDTNETMNYQSGNTWNISVTLNETGTWSFTCYANDTVGNVNFTSIPNSNPVFLNVTLNAPTSGEEKSVIQNKTFWINASVKCEGDPSIDCGEVNGTARYNASSSDPDTVIPASGTPFYTTDLQPQSCGILIGGDTCQLNWSVNATGAVDSYWSVDVNFSSNESISSNDTEDAFVKITSITLTSELISINPTSINQGDYSTVTGNCTVNGGSVTNAYMIIESNQTGSWEDIQTSGQNLTTNVTFYSLGNLNDGQEESSSFNVTSNIPNIYWIRIECNSTETGSDFSSSGSLQVNDTEAPQISNEQVNVSLIGNGSSAKFNASITDNVIVDSVLFEIGGENKSASNISNEWFFIETCSPGNSGTRQLLGIFTNDTSGNVNSSATSVSYECDPSPPLVENLSVTPNLVKGGDNVTLRCDSMDSNLDTVKFNITEESQEGEMVNVSGDTFETNFTTPVSSGNLTFKCIANDTLSQENSSNTTFEVDADAPGITNAYLNESGPVLTLAYVKINASVSDSHLDSVFANITRPDGGTDFLEMQNVSGVFELNYSLDTNGTFNFRVFANDTLGNENSTDTSPSSLVVNPRNLTLIVKTERSLYNRSDTVSVEVNLTSDGIGVENATLEGDANGSINFTGQEGGNYTSSFVASQTQNYTISVNVSKTGYSPVSNQTEIRVDRINITFNIAKTQYSPGETIAVEGNAFYESNSSKFPENNITLELLAESKELEVNQTNGQFSTDFLAPSSGGAFYISASVTGNDSITGTGSFVFTVVVPEPPPSDGGGGGGGGIPIEEPPSVSINIGRITPGVTNISINKSGLDIIKIQISVSSEANNVYIKIAKIEELPANVIHNVSGVVYQFLEIEHRNLLGLDNVTTYFRVNKTWINESNINISRIVLQRYAYSGWEVLPTELTGGNDEFAYFSSLSSELSIFAITGQVKTVTPSIPEIPVISELEKEIVEKLQQIRVIYQDTLTFIWAAAEFVNITSEEQKLDLIRKFILQIEDAKLQGNFELASNLIKEVEALAVDINTTVAGKLVEQGFIQGVNFALLIIIVLFIILQIEIFFLIKKKRLPRVGLIRFFNHAYRYTARALRKARRKFKLVTARPKIPEKPRKLEIKKAPLKVAKPKKRIGWVGFKKKIISKYRTLVSRIRVAKPVKKAKIEHEIKMPKLKPPKIKILTRLRKYKTVFKNKLRLLLRPKHPRPKKLEIEWIPAKGKLEIKQAPAKRIEPKKRIKLEIGKALGRYKTRLINKIRLRIARPKIPEKPRKLEIKRVSIEAAKPKKEARLLRIEKALGRYKNRLIDKVRLLRITKPEVKKREKIKAKLKRKPKKWIGWVEFKKKIISKYRTLVSGMKVPEPEKEEKQKEKKPVKKVEIEHEIKMPIRPVLRKYKTKLVSKTRWVRVRIRKLKRKALKEERHIEKFIKRGETGLMKREKQLKKKIYAEKKPLRIRFKRYRRMLKKFGKALYLKLRKGEKKSKSHEKVLEFEIKKILKTKKNQKGKSKNDKGDD